MQHRDLCFWRLQSWYTYVCTDQTTKQQHTALGGPKYNARYTISSATTNTQQMTIVEAIKKALKEQGVSESHAERVQKAFGVNAVDGVASAVKAFKEYMLPAIEEAGKAATEKASSEARKNAIADYEKAHGLKDGKPIAPDPTQPIPQKPFGNTAPTGDNAELAELNKQLQEIRSKIAKSEAEAANAARLSEAKAAIQKAGLPESWVSRINTAADASIEEQVKTLGDELTAIRQEAINQNVASGGMRSMPAEDSSRTAEDWAALMNTSISGRTDAGTAPLFDDK